MYIHGWLSKGLEVSFVVSTIILSIHTHTLSLSLFLFHVYALYSLSHEVDPRRWRKTNLQLYDYWQLNHSVEKRCYRILCDRPRLGVATPACLGKLKLISKAFIDGVVCFPSSLSLSHTRVSVLQLLSLITPSVLLYCLPQNHSK